MAFPISLFTPMEAENMWVGELSDVMEGKPSIPAEIEVEEEGELLIFVPTFAGRREGELLYMIYQNAPTGRLLKLFND